MNLIRNGFVKFSLVFLLLLLGAGCSGQAMQVAFHGLLYGIGALNVTGKYIGDYEMTEEMTGVRNGPGVSNEEIKKIKNYGFLNMWSLKKGIPQDFKSVSEDFLEKLGKEIGKVDGRDTVVTEAKLLERFPALKSASDFQQYLETAKEYGLDGVFTTGMMYPDQTKYELVRFSFVLYDTKDPAKKKVLLKIWGKFKEPKSIDDAAISIAETFFKSAATDAPAATTKQPAPEE
ncbi:MAG: hypothetical protein HYT28_03680 [Parcubacteria group bacterium]|nr:hypothetical protein [Parcubacteria group bacterium]